MGYLFPPTPALTLPVSLGEDIKLTFKNRVPGSDPATYTDYPAGISIKLVVGKGSSAIVAPATITGFIAICKIESERADKIADGAVWRCIVSDDLGNDTVPINGPIERHDGSA
jgi:hypothetical protein